MARILCLETSTKMCSVALSTEQGVVAFRNHREEGYSHAEKLHVLIREVMEEAQLTYADLDGIGVARGPGSFTGLRIGVSAAKGLAYAWNLKLLSCTSLEVLVAGALATKEASPFILPMLDARRMEVYCQTFENGVPVDSVRAQVVDAEGFSELHDKHVLFCGDGALKCEAVLGRPGWTFKEQFPQAQHMHHPMQQAWTEERFEDVAYFEPFYLKDFIAGKPKPSPFA